MVIENSTNVRFVNNAPNSNLNILFTINNYNNSLFLKSYTSELHFYYKYDTGFKPSPGENSRIDVPWFFSLLWFLFLFKLKKRSILYFVFATITIFYLVTISQPKVKFNDLHSCSKKYFFYI